MKNISIVFLLFLFVTQLSVIANDEIYEKLKNSGNYDKVEKIDYGNSFNCFYKTTKNNKHGAYDQYGYTVTAPVYDDINLSVEKTNNYRGEIFVVTDGGKKGAYRRKESTYILAVPILYDNVDLLMRDYSEYFIAVTMNGKKGIYISTDRTGGIVTLPPVFDEISMPNAQSIVTKQFGKYGVYNWDRQVVPILYDKVEPSGSSIIVTLNNQKGAYHDGTLIVPIGYDEVKEADSVLSFTPLQEPKFIVKKNNKYGVYNFIPREFDSIETVYRGFITEKNGKYGLYHLTKGKLLNPEYDKIYSTSNTNLACEKNGKVVKEFDMDMQSVSENIEEAVIKTLFFPLFWGTQGLH